MWWEYLLIAAVLLLGIYGFTVIVGFQTKNLTRRTNRTAESMYSAYAGRRRRQRRGQD
jgi:hypothetical protein